MQNAASELRSLAKSQGDVLYAEQIREAFEGETLSMQEMAEQIRALRAAGIRILAGESAPGPSGEEMPGTRTPLTEEEQAYLRELLASLYEIAPGADASEPFFEAFSKGEPGSEEALIALYLPKAALLAAKFNAREMALADLIQEAQMALVLCVQKERPQSEAAVEAGILSGIRKSLSGAVSMSETDERLIERVEKLEKAIRELNEDGGERFTLTELSIILDKDPEEIRGILRLTGDDA